MNRAFAWTGVAVLVATLAACAPQPHTEGSMLSGSHSMGGGPKSGTNMSNEAMPQRAFRCTEAALATMPPEHRQACEQGR